MSCPAVSTTANNIVVPENTCVKINGIMTLRRESYIGAGSLIHQWVA